MDLSDSRTTSSVFLVCADPSTSRSLLTLVVRAGYVSCGCAAASEAIGLLESADADLVVIDLSEDGMGAFLEVGATIVRTLQIPVVYLGGGDRRFLDCLVEAGASAILPKPFKIQQFQAALCVAQSKSNYAAENRADEETTDTVVRLNSDRKVAFASRGFMERFLPPGETAVGRPFLDWIHDDEQGRIPAPGTNGSGYVFQKFVDARCITLTGWRWYRWYVSIHPSANEMLLQLRGLDVTQDRMREQQLSKLSQAVEQSPVAILMADAQGNVNYANACYSETTGYTMEEILDARLKLLETARIPEATMDELWETLAEGKSWSGELCDRKKCGEPYWVSVTIAPIFDSRSRRSQLLIIQEDITERRKMEEQVREAQKMENLGTLSSGIAHDFNNILAAVSGYTELARLKPDSPQHVETCLGKSLEAVRRAIALVKQILTFSRASSSEYRGVDVNSLIRDLISMAGETFPRTIEFQFQADEDLPMINGDPNQLYQVLLNAAVNARDAMKGNGKLVFSTKVVVGSALPLHITGARQGTWVRLSVRDDGCGMEASVLEKIFQPFYTTKEEGTGTGLGLAVTNGIIRNHGGHIHVESSPGIGTVFHYFLPVREISAGDGAIEEMREVVLDGNGQVVLCVEDEPHQAALLTSLLEKRGFRVLTATDGPAGIRSFREHADEIGLLVCDVGLPGIDGWEMFRQIREFRPDLKALFVSGYLAEETQRSIREDPVVRFVQKPYKLNTLLRGIQNLLEQ